VEQALGELACENRKAGAGPKQACLGARQGCEKLFVTTKSLFLADVSPVFFLTQACKNFGLTKPKLFLGDSHQYSPEFYA
jgi:hypothetical protein